MTAAIPARFRLRLAKGLRIDDGGQVESRKGTSKEPTRALQLGRERSF